MSFKVGNKNVSCDIDFDMEGDNGEEINASIVIDFVRPTSTSNEEFSELATAHIIILQKIQGAIDSIKTGSVDEAVKQGDRVIALKKEGKKEYGKIITFVHERIKGWGGVFVNDDGEGEPFSVEKLDKLFDVPEAKEAVISRYRELVSGRKKEAAENLKK